MRHEHPGTPPPAGISTPFACSITHTSVQHAGNRVVNLVLRVHPTGCSVRSTTCLQHGGAASRVSVTGKQDLPVTLRASTMRWWELNGRPWETAASRRCWVQRPGRPGGRARGSARSVGATDLGGECVDLERLIRRATTCPSQRGAGEPADELGTTAGNARHSARSHAQLPHVCSDISRLHARIVRPARQSSGRWPRYRSCPPSESDGRPRRLRTHGANFESR